MILLDEAKRNVVPYLYVWVYLLLFFFKEKHLRAIGSKFQLFIPLPRNKQHEGFSPHVTHPKPLGVCMLWYFPYPDILLAD